MIERAYFERAQCTKKEEKKVRQFISSSKAIISRQVTKYYIEKFCIDFSAEVSP